MEPPTPKPFTPPPPQPASIPLHMDFVARWTSPPSPEEFMFPYVEATVACLDASTGEMSTGHIRTLGSHEPNDIFVNMVNNIVNQRMFPGVHKPLFTALMIIKDSDDYKREHEAWIIWKQGQPSNFHDKIIKRAKGFDVEAVRPPDHKAKRTIKGGR